jgi:hypothetical protein
MSRLLHAIQDPTEKLVRLPAGGAGLSGGRNLPLPAAARLP